MLQVPGKTGPGVWKLVATKNRLTAGIKISSESLRSSLLRIDERGGKFTEDLRPEPAQLRHLVAGN